MYTRLKQSEITAYGMIWSEKGKKMKIGYNPYMDVIFTGKL